MVRLNIYFKTRLHSAAFGRCNTLWPYSSPCSTEGSGPQASPGLLVADQVDGKSNPRSPDGASRAALDDRQITRHLFLGGRRSLSTSLGLHSVLNSGAYIGLSNQRTYSGYH